MYTNQKGIAMGNQVPPAVQQQQMQTTSTAQQPSSGLSLGNTLKNYKDYIKSYGENKRKFAGQGDWQGWLNWLQQTKKDTGFIRKAGRKDFEANKVAALRDRLGSEADEFQSKIPQLTTEQYGLLKGDVQGALDEGLKDTRQNYSSRGLLFSGLRQGDESSKRGQAASTLAQGRAGINRELMDMASSKKNIAAQVGLASYQQALDSAANLENINMQNAIARRQSAADLGRGLGYAAGTYLGSQDGGGSGGMASSSGGYSSIGPQRMFKG